jgi:hypothetical protein
MTRNVAIDMEVHLQTLPSLLNLAIFAKHVSYAKYLADRWTTYSYTVNAIPRRWRRDAEVCGNVSKNLCGSQVARLTKTPLPHQLVAIMNDVERRDARVRRLRSRFCDVC